MNRRAAILRWTVAIATTVVECSGPAFAVARLGGETDDSVCDVGRTDQRMTGALGPQNFVATKCRNGQLLMATSVVPAGGFEPATTSLGKTFCRIADIQSRRFQENVGPLPMEFEELRCQIAKLPK